MHKQRTNSGKRPDLAFSYIYFWVYAGSLHTCKGIHFPCRLLGRFLRWGRCYLLLYIYYAFCGRLKSSEEYQVSMSVYFINHTTVRLPPTLMNLEASLHSSISLKKALLGHLRYLHPLHYSHLERNKENMFYENVPPTKTWCQHCSLVQWVRRGQQTLLQSFIICHLQRKQSKEQLPFYLLAITVDS